MAPSLLIRRTFFRHCLLAPVLFCIALRCGAQPPEEATPPETPAPEAVRTITVVMDDNYPPYTFRDSSGKLQGILPDLWYLWQQKTGVGIKLEGMDWLQAQQTMAAGKADVIDTMFETPERQRHYAFSPPYAHIDVAIFFHKTIGGITNEADSLKGFTVGVKAGDACIERLNADGIHQQVAFASYENMLKAAGRGDIKVMCIDKPPGLHFLYKLGLQDEFRTSLPLYSGDFHWAVRKASLDTYQLVSEGFAQISQSERDAIDDRWLGASLTRGRLAPYLSYAAHALVIGAGISLVLFLWVFSLRRRVNVRTRELSDTLQALQAAQQDSEKALDSLNTTLEALPDLMTEVDGEGRIYSYRAARDDMMLIPPEDFLQRNIDDVLPIAAAAVIREALEEARQTGASYGLQYLLSLPEGEHWYELSVARKKGNETPPRFVVLSRNITERKYAEAEIQRLAFYDPLTQLPNRRLILDRLQQAVAASERHHNHGALLFIDLDNFKTLNDTQGHKTGDLLLKEVSLRLKSCVRTEDSIARLGGDEFVILLEDLSPRSDEAAAQVETISQKILDKIALPFRFEGYEHHSSASIGVCLFAGRTESEDEIMKRADVAMYRAKTSGRNTCCFFDPALQASLENRARLEAELRRALPERQLLLYYQAQVDNAGRVIGAEVLLRWDHPERGMVSPLQFIPLAEETGLIVPIGHWVMEEACRRVQQWSKDARTRYLSLSVNVSARQFRQPDFVQEVAALLRQHDTEPSRLKLELTESLVLDNVADSIEKMYALKSLGVPFSMDDFGTGYSSLSYLKRLPLDQLKIDQTFVRDIVTDPGDAIIVKTIIGMARNLGLDVIAEGVETVAQKEFLLQNDCLKFQGYLFSRPLPLADFEALLDQQDA